MADAPSFRFEDYVHALIALEKQLPGASGHRALKKASEETARFSFVYR